MSAFSITARDIESYENDGAVCLRGAFEQRWLDLLAEGTDKDIAAPGPLHTLQQSAADPGFFLTDFCLAQRLEEFRAFVFDSPAGEAAARLMGSKRINFFYDGIWVKGEGTPKRTRWHQDQPYYPVDGRQICVIWLPLDPVPREVCLELVAGSHRWGRWFKPELTRAGQDLYPEDASLERMPDIEGERAQHRILTWDMTPGDCILFHGLTVHGAPGNASRQRRRRAVSSIWLGDDAVFARRPGAVRPNFEGHGLAPGDSMDSPYFPRAWPSDGRPDPQHAARFTDPGLKITI